LIKKQDPENDDTKINSLEEPSLGIPEEEITISNPRSEDIQQPKEIDETLVSSEVTPIKDTKLIRANNVNKTSSNNRFFIIAGSFSKESNAVRLINSLKSNGFDAIIADTSNQGMYRVAFNSYKFRSTAKQELVAIRENENPNAWLLVK
jgi:cell division protein FtsN